MTRFILTALLVFLAAVGWLAWSANPQWAAFR